MFREAVGFLSDRISTDNIQTPLFVVVLLVVVVCCFIDCNHVVNDTESVTNSRTGLNKVKKKVYSVQCLLLSSEPQHVLNTRPDKSPHVPYIPVLELPSRPTTPRYHPQPRTLPGGSPLTLESRKPVTSSPRDPSGVVWVHFPLIQN